MSAVSAAALDPRPRRARGRVLLAASALVAAGAGAWALVSGDDQGGCAPSVAGDRVPTALSRVTRGDLVDRQDVEGVLGFAGSRTLGAPTAGWRRGRRSEVTTPSCRRRRRA